MSYGQVNELIHKTSSENKNKDKDLVSKPGPKPLPKTSRGASSRNTTMAFKKGVNHLQDITDDSIEVVSVSIHPSSNLPEIPEKDWTPYQAESKFASPEEGEINLQEKNGLLHANVPKGQIDNISSKQQFIYKTKPVKVVNRDTGMDSKPVLKPLAKPRYLLGARSSNTPILSTKYSAKSPATTEDIDYSLPKAGISVKTIPVYPRLQFNTDLNEDDSKPEVAKKSTVSYVNRSMSAYVVQTREENSPNANTNVTTEKSSLSEDQFLTETTADSGVAETVKNLSKCPSKPGDANEIDSSEKNTVSSTTSPNPDFKNITEEDMKKRNQTNGFVKGSSPHDKFIKSTTESNKKTANPYVNWYITSNRSGRMKIGTYNTTMECEGESISGNNLQDTKTVKENIALASVSKNSSSNLTCIEEKGQTSYKTEPNFACVFEQSETAKQDKCGFLQAYVPTISKDMSHAAQKFMSKNRSANIANIEKAKPIPKPRCARGAIRRTIPNRANSPETTKNINDSLSTIEIDVDCHPKDTKRQFQNGTRTCDREQDATAVCYSDNSLPSNQLPTTSKTAYSENPLVPLPRKRKLGRAHNRDKIFGGHLQKFPSEQNVGFRKNTSIDQHESGSECQATSKDLLISDEVLNISSHIKMHRLTQQQNGVRCYHIVLENPLYMNKTPEVHPNYQSYRHIKHSDDFVETYPPRIPPKQRPFNGTHTSKLGIMSSNFEFQPKIDDQVSLFKKHSNCGCVHNNLAVCDEREAPPRIPPKQRPLNTRANERVWSNMLSPIIEENLPPELPIKLQRAVLSESLPDNHIMCYAPSTTNQYVPFPGDNVKLRVLPTYETKGTRYVNKTFSTNPTRDVPCAIVQEKLIPKPRARKSKNITETGSDIVPRLPPRLYETRMSLDEQFQGLSVIESIMQTNESNSSNKGKADHNKEYSSNCFQKQIETALSKKSASITEENIGNVSSAKDTPGKQSSKNEVYDYASCVRIPIYADIAELYIPEKSTVENSHIYEQVDPTDLQDKGNLTSGKSDVEHQTSKDYDYDYPDCNKLSRLAKAYKKWCLSLCPKCQQKPRNYSHTKTRFKGRLQKTGDCFKSKGSTAMTTDRKCSCKNETTGSHQTKTGQHGACSSGSCGSHNFCSCSSQDVPVCSCGNSSCGSENSLSCSSRHFVPACSCGNSSCGSFSFCSCSSRHYAPCSCGNSSCGSFSSCSCSLRHCAPCSCGNSSCGSFSSCSCSSRHCAPCSCGNSSCGSFSSCSCSSRHCAPCSCGNSSCGSFSSCSCSSRHYAPCSCGNSSCGSFSSCSCSTVHNACRKTRQPWASSCKSSSDPTCWKGNDQRELDNIFSMVYFPGNARSPTFCK